MTKRIVLIALIVLSAVGLTACAGGNAVSKQTKTYEVTSDIHSLDIEINAAEFIIEEADEFLVESNLKNLSVSEKDGVLKIVDKTRYSARYNDAVLKLYIPKDITFEEASIKTGAGKLTAESLSANYFELKAGAGQVEFDCLEVLTDVEIKGGAGEIIIKDGTLNNLHIDLGAGRLDLTAALLGKSDLKFGLGESDITLLGSKDDYKFDVKNGIGRITIDDEDAFGFAFAHRGNGENFVKIEGGLGATTIRFK